MLTQLTHNVITTLLEGSRNVRSYLTLPLHSYNVVYLLEYISSSVKRRSDVEIGRAYQDVQITSLQRHMLTLMQRYKMTYCMDIYTTSVQRYSLTHSNDVGTTLYFYVDAMFNCGELNVR